MNISHLTSAHPRYDTRIFHKMCRSLANHGYSVNLVVADGKGNKTREGVNIIDVGASKGRFDRIRNAPGRVFAKAVALDADLYHLHDPELIPIGLKLKKLGKQVIFDIHENTGLQIRTKGWIPHGIRTLVSFVYERYERWAFKKFDSLIVPQIAMQAKYADLSPTVLIANFPNLADASISSIRREYTKYNLFYAGGLSSARGLFNMLDLIVELRTRNPNYKLTLAGSISKRDLKKVKKHMGWSFTHYQGLVSKENVYKSYNKNSIGLILFNNVGQYYMAYSLKLFEYMQNGMLVIMPDFGDWMLFNESYQAGLNVPVNSSKHIADIIDRLSEEDFDRFRTKSAGLIQNVFNWESQEKILLSTYAELLNAK